MQRGPIPACGLGNGESGGTTTNPRFLHSPEGRISLLRSKNFTCRRHISRPQRGLFTVILLATSPAGPHPRLWFGERGTGRTFVPFSQLARRANFTLAKREFHVPQAHFTPPKGALHCDVACNITRGAPSPLVVWGTGERGACLVLPCLPPRGRGTIRRMVDEGPPHGERGNGRTVAFQTSTLQKTKKRLSYQDEKTRYHLISCFRLGESDALERAVTGSRGGH